MAQNKIIKYELVVKLVKSLPRTGQVHYRLQNQAGQQLSAETAD